MVPTRALGTARVGRSIHRPHTLVTKERPSVSLTLFCDILHPNICVSNVGRFCAENSTERHSSVAAARMALGYLFAPPPSPEMPCVWHTPALAYEHGQLLRGPPHHRPR